MTKSQESAIIQSARIDATSRIVESILRELSQNLIQNLEQSKLQNLIRTVYTALDGRAAINIDNLF